MATLGEAVQLTLNSIIDTFGSDAQLYSISGATITYNEEGDKTITWGTPTTIKVVPSDYLKQNREREKQGEEETNEITFLVKGTTTIVKDDKIVFNSESFIVDEVHPYYLTGTQLATRVVCHKE